MQVHTCTFIEYKHTHTQVYVLADRQTDRQTCYVLLLTCLSLALMTAPLSSRRLTTSK